MEPFFFIQVCGSQGTVHLKTKVVTAMNNWKESAVIEVETNPLKNVRGGLFCIFLPVAAAFLLQGFVVCVFFLFLFLLLINSLP